MAENYSRAGRRPASLAAGRRTGVCVVFLGGFLSPNGAGVDSQGVGTPGAPVSTHHSPEGATVDNRLSLPPLWGFVGDGVSSRASRPWLLASAPLGLKEKRSMRWNPPK